MSHPQRVAEAGHEAWIENLTHVEVKGARASARVRASVRARVRVSARARACECTRAGVCPAARFRDM